MTSDLRNAALDVATRASRLADAVTPRLPALIQARALLALEAQRAELDRHLDAVEGARASMLAEPAASK